MSYLSLLYVLYVIHDSIGFYQESSKISTWNTYCGADTGVICLCPERLIRRITFSFLDLFVSVLHYGSEQPNVSYRPLAQPFAHKLAPLTRSLASHCLFHLRAPLRSFVPLLNRSLTHSQARGTVNDES